MLTIIRLYEAVVAVALMVVVAVVCGLIAGVITGANGPDIPVSAIAFLLTGAFLFFRFRRNAVLPPVHAGI